MKTDVGIVRVFTDSSSRNGQVGWGAVIVVEGRKPHVIGGIFTRKVPKKSHLAEFAASKIAMIRAYAWLRRNGLKAGLLIVHTDCQSILPTLELEVRKTGVFRWIARQHPMMQIAHRRARVL